MSEYNLIVIGGGLSGVAAAVCAAREGLNVLLVERMGCLGGAMSNCSVYPFMKHAIKYADGTKRILSAGIFAEMCKRHRELGGVSERGWQPEIFKIMLDRLVEESSVKVMFHTQLIDVVKEDRKISAVRLLGKHGIFEVNADYFIDASGDGDLMAYAGCEYQLGRESDGLCQPMKTNFRISGVDIEKYKEDKPYLQELFKRFNEEGKISVPRENMLINGNLGEGVLHFNSTRVVKMNPLDSNDLSLAEMEARRQVLEIYNFLRTNSDAFKNSTLVLIAPEIGVRESRKIKGVHVLTADELKQCVDFEDSIALGNYMIDIHNPDGVGTYRYRFQPEEYYRIPYRSLVPKEIDNMLVAGRCLSADHEAHSAVRIMPICACLGQAAGTAIAQAQHTGKTVHNVDVSAVQSKLVANGAEIH